ncbi:unnamed protein product [Didymodactylos carnosus]|uniref:Protein kinase domain-containing protein n=1 Tax=Didymodactylos carnosus TaxID=1234261 RepID=A0A813SUV1_9BILA|nr:unnamed protein product [Didymodactylos carnosus]CAF1222979.1 unnamed protein product [Didymodactylos carnosus]CAF3586204.1 unnamed protein product [Didymodactylos carnosus]CAF4031274.1 unnamed protein product [Didymodactylos carnosus]
MSIKLVTMLTMITESENKKNVMLPKTTVVKITSSAISLDEVQYRMRRRKYSLTSPRIFESSPGYCQTTVISGSKRFNFQQLYSIDLDTLFPSSNEKYDIIRKLSSGAYCSSYSIRDSVNNQIYLLKRYELKNVSPKSSLGENIYKRMHEERRLLGALQSNYILTFISSFTEYDQDCYAIKFEYVTGVTLFHLLRRFRWLEEKAVCFYGAQIVLALEYLHELNIIYRNLKSETILIGLNGYIKLCDFGFATVLPNRESKTSTILGVPDYMPPEMLIGQPYSFSVDWWQLGVILFELLTSMTPFFAREMFKTHVKTICLNRFEWPNRVSGMARQIVKNLLNKEVSKRLGCTLSDASELKRNLWFQNNIEWTTLFDQQYPAPYKLKSLDPTNNATILNSIESRRLEEYETTVQELTREDFDNNYTQDNKDQFED